MSESRRLGRGLEALLGPISKEEAVAAGSLRDLPVASIVPNPFQPRRTFDETALQELTDSIAASGLLQPIVVRPRPTGGHELIAGERRWRAVQRLGWATVPAVIKEADDRTVLTLALIENLQRDELSPIDEAEAFRRLIDEFEISQVEVARLVGRHRATVSNTLRLLGLPEDVRQMVHGGLLSEGHARALLTVTDGPLQKRLAATAVAEQWSVRELEARARGELPGKARRLRPAKEPPRSQLAEIRQVEDSLRTRFSTDVRVTARRRGRGFVTLSYYSNDDLARLLELMLGEPFGG